jgi:hypothetical protein
VFYDQIDGVAMGSPLGPLFANVFMTNFERSHSAKLKELGVNLWLRYVDDIFATLDDKGKAEKVLLYLNQQHPNIKFTVEHENDAKLPFLDTTVYRGLRAYNTTLYRKKTFTGVYLNWTSLTSKRYKIGLIYCLLDRIWKICSETSERENEISKLKTILAKNDYPDHVIDREINKFVANRSKATPPSTDEQPPQPNKPPQPPEQQQPPIDTQPPTRFIVLPYVSHKAEGFAKRLKGLVNTYYPKVDFNVAFKTPNEIGKFFPFKDNIKKTESRSLVVYRIKCANCDASYIGKTERILIHRLNEHRKSNNSACFQHEHENRGHKMAFERVEILDTADSNYKLELKELLHIIHHKPTLNRQLNSQSQYNVKTLIIAAYPQYVDEAVRPYSN